MESTNASDQLLCLFNAEVEERNGSYVVELPDRELSIGDLREDRVYRVGILSPRRESGANAEPQPEQKPEPDRESGRPEPPVEEGDRREVEIEDVGDQGDGIARIDRGFVVIVPDAEIGDRLRVEITHIQENYAVGEIVEGLEVGV